ncbi:MAG: hypothetical protein HC908_10175 [Calothrix sp. SM1_7_51]|nr:hypothetical protein [Calothrix sp. SM1_7_51]
MILKARAFQLGPILGIIVEDPDGMDPALHLPRLKGSSSPIGRSSDSIRAKYRATNTILNLLHSSDGWVKADSDLKMLRLHQKEWNEDKVTSYYNDIYGPPEKRFIAQDGFSIFL